MTAEYAFPVGQRLDYATWRRLPETKNVEVVDGEPTVNEPTLGHQFMAYRLARTMEPYVPDGYLVLPLGQDWVLRESPLLVRVPDVLVLPADAPRDEHILAEPPLLVAEILSPSTRRTDLVAKRHEYAAAGLQHYLIADPGEPPLLAYYRLIDGRLHEERGLSTEPLQLPEPFSCTLLPEALA